MAGAPATAATATPTAETAETPAAEDTTAGEETPAAEETGAAEEATEAVQGIIRDAENEPLEGIVLEVEGEGFSGEATTDETGRWRVDLPGPGTYTVAVVEDSLPEGATLRNPERNPLELEVQPGQARGALFPIGEGVRDTVGLGERLVQTAAYGLRFGLLLALAAVGLSLIFGTTGLTNFAHGEMVTLGGILGYYTTVTFGLPFLLAAVVVFFLVGAFGLLQDTVLWSPLRRRGTGLIGMMIVSIGLAILLRYTYLYFFGGRTRTLAESAWLNQIVAIGPIRYRVMDLVSMAICVVAIAAVGFLLLRTRIGKGTRAVADNPPLASASGIDVEHVIRFVWFLGAGLAGLAGVLLGGFQQVSFQMGFQLLLLIFAAVVLGGLGTAFGALVGALVVGLLVEMSVLVLPSEIRNVAALAVLIVVLLVRPQGILGRRERIG